MTNQLILGWAALFGLIIGSFLNVVILRDNHRKSILKGRSHCPHCQHQLAWYDLIPVVSFLTLAARCRYCKKVISWQYPLVELTSAIIIPYALSYGYFQRESWLLTILLAISLSLFLVVSIIDIRTMEIPLEYVLVASVLGSIGMLISQELTLLEVALGLVVGAGSLAFILYGWKFLFKEAGMGVGDIWLAGGLGAVVGYPLIIINLFSAVMIGALVGLLILGWNRKSLKTAIPFGPFLSLGLLIALNWGQSMINWYIL